MDESEKELLHMAITLIKEFLPKIIEKVKDKSKNRIDENKINKAFENYYKTSIAKYACTKTLFSSQNPLKLYDIYVNMELKNPNGEIVSTENINEVLDINNKIIIKGTAGCGKSTLAKYLFLKSIEEKDRLQKIPIFIELRNIKEGYNSFLEFLHQYLLDYNLRLELEELELFLTTDYFIFFLDGFDEIPPEYTKEMEEKIIKFSDKFYSNHIVVTSRPDERFIAWSNFIDLGIVPLSKEKSMELIKKIDYNEEDRQNFINKLDEGLYNKHISFASNPLLLIIMLLTFSRCADIPTKTHLFYEEAFNALFEVHDSTKSGYKRNIQSKLEKDDFKRILNSFSVISYFNNKINFSEKEADEYIRRTKELVNIEFNEKLYLEDLLKSLCLMVKDGTTITFAHRTFQEYFAACYIVETNDNERQRKIIETLFLEKYGLGENVLSFIFQIDRKKLENYLIDILEEIKKNTEYDKLSEEESYYLFIINTLTTIFFEDTIEIFDSPYPIGYGAKNENYLNVVDFISQNYSKVFENPFIDEIYDSYGELEDVLKKYPDILMNDVLFNPNTGIETTPQGKTYGFKITDIENKEDLITVVKNGYILKKEYFFSMYVLGKIKNEANQREKSIDELLFKN